MYTIVIINEQSSALLKDYKILFEPFVDSGQMSFCGWNESGIDINSSIPDLYKLIKGKTRWRVIIALTPQEMRASDYSFEHDVKNPFDYLCNLSQDCYIEESGVPLVRLTHMLGGFPDLGIKEMEERCLCKNLELGKDEIIDLKALSSNELEFIYSEYGKNLNIIYTENKYTEEEIAQHNRVKNMYKFDEDRPEEIYLISTRTKSDDDNKTKIYNSWQNNIESQSSDFWERNMYPNSCRFMTCDLSNIGNSAYKKELFGFWLTVLTIATNKISASTLQAYRLYRVHVDILETELENSLNKHLSKLIESLNNVNIRIKSKPNYSFDKYDTLVKPQNVPVIFEQGRVKDIIIETSTIGFFKDYPENEQTFWNNNYIEKRNNLEKLLKERARVVDISSEYARSKADSFLGDEYELDKYQFEDLKDMIEKLEWKVITTDTKNIIDSETYKNQLKNADKEVRKYIDIRLRKKIIVISGVLSLVLYLTGFVPYIIGAGVSGSFILACSAAMTLLAVIIAAAGGMAALYLLRHRLIKKIEAFNKVMYSIQANVFNGARKFENYISDVCTYMKAQSILKGVILKDDSNVSTVNLLKVHKISLKRIIEHEEELCAVFDIPLLIEPVINISLFFNPDVPPAKNPIYRFEPNYDELDIPINETGDLITAPYKFVSKLSIEREELYDNTKGDLQQ